MSRRSTLRAITLLSCVVVLVLGVASTAFAFTQFPVTPNFDGTTMNAGSTLTLNWTSPSTLPLVVTQTIFTTNPDGTIHQESTDVASGLSANGSYAVTIPAAAVGKTVGYRITAPGMEWYSDSFMWQIKVVAAAAPPVTSTPASSPWSLGLMAFAGLALVGGTTLAKKRSAA